MQAFLSLRASSLQMLQQRDSWFPCAAQEGYRAPHCLPIIRNSIMIKNICIAFLVTKGQNVFPAPSPLMVSHSHLWWSLNYFVPGLVPHQPHLPLHILTPSLFSVPAGSPQTHKTYCFPSCLSTFALTISFAWDAPPLHCPTWKLLATRDHWNVAALNCDAASVKRTQVLRT